MKKVKNKVWQGSYTVEAAFIMPLVILVIIALIYMAMYMHDKNKIKAVLDKMSIEGSFIIKHETDDMGNIQYEKMDNRGIFFPLLNNCQNEEDILIHKLNSQLAGGLILGEIKNISVKANHTKIEISAKVNMNISLFKIREYFGNRSSQIVIMGVGDVYYPAEFVRKFHGIENIADDIKSYDEILKKLQKLLSGSKDGSKYVRYIL